MAAAKFEDILKDIHAKKFAPIYYFYGEEEYRIDQLVEALEKNVLTESEKAFNLTIAYGKDLSFQGLMEACKRPPMGAALQLVIVKEAQSFQLKSDDEQIEKLITHYAKNPIKSTILAFAYKHGSPDKRKKINKVLIDNAVSFESKPLYDNQVIDWVRNYVMSKGFQINDDALFLFIEFTGSDLSVVTNEIDKLILTQDKTQAITLKKVEDSVGLLKDFSVFELNNAIGAKNKTKAYRIVNYFKHNPKNGPLILVLGTLHSFFSKLFIAATNKTASDGELASLLKVNPFFIKDYKTAMRHFSPQKIEEVFYILAEYDQRNKGINNFQTSESELMREMVFRILND